MKDMLFVLLYIITKNIMRINSSDKVRHDIISEYTEVKVIELNRMHVTEGRDVVVKRKMCLGR